MPGIVKTQETTSSKETAKYGGVLRSREARTALLSAAHHSAALGVFSALQRKE